MKNALLAHSNPKGFSIQKGETLPKRLILEVEPIADTLT